MIIEYANEIPVAVSISEGEHVCFSSAITGTTTCQWEDMPPRIQKEFLVIGKSIEVLSKRCLDLLHSDEIAENSVKAKLTSKQRELFFQAAQKDEGS